MSGRLDWIANYIWGIADDVLRDLYVRGKYRDVILPMTVLRRLDAVLEDTKQQVLDMSARLDEMGVGDKDGPLREAARHAFYNTSPFTMRDLRARSDRQQLRADFEAYLDGFSPNVADIIDNFEFRNQIDRLSRADALGSLIEKLTSPDINLSPHAVMDSDGSERHPGLDNHAMGTIFEELVRRFNEENNEEAGEHWTPRDAVTLMARLVFEPVAGQIESSTYLIYDGACGTGGMLTLADDTLQEIAAERGKQVSTHLYGQEINAETYAICKADMLLKGEAADNFVGGPEHSTLSNDSFPDKEFDFMLSNPPYGKSWKTDLQRMGGKTGMRDPRFVIHHAGDPAYSLVTRSSDGQMLFLASMVSKMKHATPLGSRIAEVHNGSSLFAGDAGQGESNIRRWIIENDWLETVVALPLNMFYNTGIATFIWVITNRKPEHRRGKVQLIDATEWFRPLRKNLGKKTCELSDDDIRRVCDTFLGFEESEQSKIFPNEAFGYWKATVDRPLRLAADLSLEQRALLRAACVDANEARLADLIDDLAQRVGPGPHLNYNRFEVLPHDPDIWYDPATIKVGYEINFNRHFYKPEPMRSLEEIRADLTALEQETVSFLDLTGFSPDPAEEVRWRVYVDTSVFGASQSDEEDGFREPSQQLFRDILANKFTLVLSDVTQRELDQAPEAVQAVLSRLPFPQTEYAEASGEAEALAERYILDGALTLKSWADALHIATATVAGVDLLVSWNFKHIVNARRIRAFNRVNVRAGYSQIDIRKPKEAIEYE